MKTPGGEAANGQGQQGRDVGAQCVRGGRGLRSKTCRAGPSGGRRPSSVYRGNGGRKRMFQACVRTERWRKLLLTQVVVEQVARARKKVRELSGAEFQQPCLHQDGSSRKWAWKGCNNRKFPGQQWMFPRKAVMSPSNASAGRAERPGQRSKR